MESPPAVRADVLAILGHASQMARKGRDPQARSLFHKAAALDATPWANWLELEFLCSRGDFPAALVAAQGLREQALRAGDLGWNAMACQALAAIHRELGRWHEAASWQQRAISIRRAFDASDLSGLANDALVRGRFRIAWRMFLLALRCEQADGGDPGRVASDIGGLGNAAAMAGRLRLAERLYGHAVRWHRRAADREGLARDFLNLARVSAAREDWSRAISRTACALRWASRCRHAALHAEAALLGTQLRRRHRAVATEPSRN